VPLEVRTHSAHYPALSSTRTRVGLASHEQKSQVRGKKPPAARLLTAPNPRCLFPPAASLLPLTWVSRPVLSEVLSGWLSVKLALLSLTHCRRLPHFTLHFTTPYTPPFTLHLQAKRRLTYLATTSPPANPIQALSNLAIEIRGLSRAPSRPSCNFNSACLINRISRYHSRAKVLPSRLAPSSPLPPTPSRPS
jgi:hypothetical protein